MLQGSGVHLLKAGSKRRRTKAEIIDAEQLKLEEENMIRAKLARLDEVELMLAASEKQVGDMPNHAAAMVLNDLLKAKVVHRESDSVFVAQNAEGERRFDYEQS